MNLSGLRLLRLFAAPPLLLSVFALSCASPELLRRYASASEHPASIPDQHARLSAFVLADAPDAKSLNVAASASERTPAVVATKRPQFRKRIVLSIERAESLPPADRLERVTIKLADPDLVLVGAVSNRDVGAVSNRDVGAVSNRDVGAVSNRDRSGVADVAVGNRSHNSQTGNEPAARFLSWDKFATQYDTVDLGKLSADTTRTVDLGLSGGSATTASVPATAQTGLKLSRNLSEDLSLRSRYVVFSGALSEREARIHQEGIAGIDLAGNATLDLVVEATPAPQPQPVLQLGPLRDKNGWTKDQAAITVDREFIAYAARAAPIICQLTGGYVLRHVTRRAETLSEGDDVVEFVRGRFAAQSLTLATADELALRVWAIQTPTHDLLQLQQLGVVEFASYREALAFLGWLRATGNTAIGGYPLKIGGNTGPALDPARIGELTIYVRQLN